MSLSQVKTTVAAASGVVFAANKVAVSARCHALAVSHNARGICAIGHRGMRAGRSRRLLSGYFLGNRSAARSIAVLPQSQSEAVRSLW